MVFYLKANRDNSYVIPNLKHWIEAVTVNDNNYAYILCDNPILKEKIVKEIVLSEKVSFLESYRENNDINKILENICGISKWKKVGQAHLTTHWHATNKKYKYFWNIDADDTFFCIDPIRIAELLEEIEKYCIEKNIDMISLDMWRSMSINERWNKGDNWSLGIVFVNNMIKWNEIMINHCKDDALKDMVLPYDKDANLDWYFTYLRRISAARIETFYVENMRFMHFYDYFFNYPHLSNFCYWKNGKVNYPILESCFCSHARKQIDIAEDIIKFDIGIKDDEALLSMAAASGEVFSFWFDIRNNDLEVGTLMEKRCELFLKKKGKKKIIFWGAGGAFYRNLKLLRKICRIVVCDSDSAKWGKELAEDVECISPSEVESMRDEVFVVLMIDSPAVNLKIVNTLLKMGITSFDHFDNWIEVVTGVVED